MSYEDAPGTKMLATYCAACSRPLLDARSVETGMGPYCRAKYTVSVELDDETREKANKLVHFIACAQDDSEEVRAALDELEALGCVTIVARISKRLYGDPISVYLDGDKLCVKSPYSGNFLDASKRIRSRRWDGSNKRTTFCPSDHEAVEAALLAGYHARTRIFVGQDEDSLPEEPIDLHSLGSTIRDLCDGFEAAPPPPTPPTPIKVTRDLKTERVAIATPYNRELVDAMKTVEGRRWDGANKVNTFPLEAEEGVLGFVRAAFSRIHVVTEEGKVAAPKKRRGYSHYRSHKYAY
jgi:hypothetical protein